MDVVDLLILKVWTISVNVIRKMKRVHGVRGTAGQRGREMVESERGRRQKKRKRGEIRGGQRKGRKKGEKGAVGKDKGRRKKLMSRKTGGFRKLMQNQMCLLENWGTVAISHWITLIMFKWLHLAYFQKQFSVRIFLLLFILSVFFLSPSSSEFTRICIKRILSSMCGWWALKNQSLEKLNIRA